MAVDWDELNKNIDDIIKDAASKTDEELADKISSLTSLSKEDITKICPEKGDASKLAELIQIVKSAESQNDKINRIVSNSEKFGKIVINLLSKVI